MDEMCGRSHRSVVVGDWTRTLLNDSDDAKIRVQSFKKSSLILMLLVERRLMTAIFNSNNMTEFHHNVQWYGKDRRQMA